jgi:hypothetical protein
MDGGGLVVLPARDWPVTVNCIQEEACNGLSNYRHKQAIA